MKKKTLKGLMAGLLAVALVACCMPTVSVLQAAAAQETVVEHGFIIGEQLLYEDFSAVADNALPTGWDKDTTADYTGLLWSPTNADAYVTTVGNEKCLYYYAGGSHILALPDLGEENYVFSAKVSFKVDKGQFGLVTDLATDYKAATAFVGSNVYGTPSGGTTGARIYQRYDNGASGADKLSTVVTKTELTETYGLTIAVNTDYTLTVYRYNGKNRYYLNDIFIGEMANYATAENTTRVGLFSQTGAMYVKEVSANAISTPVDAWEKGPQVFKADFSAATADGVAIPNTWDATTSVNVYKDALCWNGATAKTDTAHIALKKVDNVNGLYLKPADSYADHILLLPDMGTENYAITAKVKALTANGTFGIATELTASPGDATAFTVGKISTHSDPSVSLGRKVANKAVDTKVSIAKADWPIVQNGEYVLQAVFCNGTTYFYIDGTLVGEYLGGTSDKVLSRVGFFTCGGTWFVTDIQVNVVKEETEDVVEGAPLFKADFSAATAEGVAIPEDWDATTSTGDTYTNLIWNGSKTQTGVENISLKTSNGENGLFLYPAQAMSYADHLLVLPALQSEDYVMTVKVKESLGKGTLGLVTGLTADYANADELIVSAISIHGDPTVFMKKHVRTDSANGKDVQVISASKAEMPLSNNTEYTLKAVHIDGVTTYYLNGAFIGQMKETATTAMHNRVGLFTCGGMWFVTEMTVNSIADKAPLTMPGASIRYANPDGTALGKDESGIRFATVLDKNSQLYQLASGEETYVYSEDAAVKFGTVLLPTDMLEEDEVLTAQTPLALDVTTKVIYSQDADTLMWMTTLLNIPQTQLARSYTARSYVEYETPGGVERVYAEQIAASPAHVANLFYPEASDSVKAKLDAIYEGVNGYMGKDMQKVTFSVMGDFHYWSGNSVSSLAHLESMFDRAAANNSQFIMHMGDFCTDYIGSPELFATYLQNEDNLPAYGLYGNHELQSAGNSMEIVTPRLTNQADNVVWGTADGKIAADGSIGYYYYDIEGFRFIVLDTNYSMDANGNWVHNVTNSYGASGANTHHDNLGDVQKAWLIDVLDDAATQKKHCLVFSHASFSDDWYPTDEAVEIRGIFNDANEKQAGTVMMVLNGHRHTNHSAIYDGILYMDVNVVNQGWWQSTGADHYTDGMTYTYNEYDSEGNFIGSTEKNLSTMGETAQRTWWYESPLSAVVTIYNNGYIQIEGAQTDWLYDVVPAGAGTNGVEPFITTQNVSLW